MKDDYFIPDEFYNLVHRKNPGEVCTSLKSMSYIRVALEVVEKKEEGHVSMLMLAAIYGSEEIVKQLLRWNPSQQHIDLCGIVKSIDGILVDDVTALWCAIDRGHFMLASLMIKMGAIKLGSRSNELFVDVFVEHGNLDAIQYLFEKKSELSIITGDAELYEYFDKAASLGHTDVVLYFLRNGIGRAIMMDLYDGLALQKAIEHGHYKCVQILCRSGLSDIESQEYNELLMDLAVEYNHLDILDFLLDFHRTEVILDKVEFLASSYMISQHDRVLLTESACSRTYNLLKHVLLKRVSLRIPKRISPPSAAYQFRQECQSVEELESIQHQPENIFIQVLLIRERLHATNDPRLITVLHHFGMIFIERNDIDQCFLLWMHRFKLCQRMTIDTDLEKFVWLFCRMFALGRHIQIESLLEICQLVFHPSQSKFTTTRLVIAVCLVAIVAKVLEEERKSLAERQLLLQWIECLCRQQPVSEDDGRTLLHLSITSELYKFIHWKRNEIESILIFPNRQATWLLVNYGRRWMDIDAVDSIYSDTPLHTISRSVTGINAIEIIKVLLFFEAHIDCLNGQKKTPLEVAVKPEVLALLKSSNTVPQLKCLCARMITDEELDYRKIWSPGTDLCRFITLHGDLPLHESISDASESSSLTLDADEYHLFD